MQNGLTGIYSYRLTDELDGRFVLLFLVLNHAQQVQSIKMRRRSTKNFAIDTLGLGQPSGLVQRHSPLDLACKRRSGRLEISTRAPGSDVRWTILGHVCDSSERSALEIEPTVVARRLIGESGARSCPF